VITIIATTRATQAALNILLLVAKVINCSINSDSFGK
jgi:hypothetical protein